MMKSGPRSPQLEKALAQKRRPNTAKNKYINKFIKKKKERECQSQKKRCDDAGEGRRRKEGGKDWKMLCLLV